MILKEDKLIFGVTVGEFLGCLFFGHLVVFAVYLTGKWLDRQQLKR